MIRAFLASLMLVFASFAAIATPVPSDGLPPWPVSAVEANAGTDTLIRAASVEIPARSQLGELTGALDMAGHAYVVIADDLMEQFRAAHTSFSPPPAHWTFIVVPDIRGDSAPVGSHVGVMGFTMDGAHVGQGRIPASFLRKFLLEALGTPA